MLAGVYYFYSINAQKNQQATSIKPSSLKLSLTNECRAVPKFIAPLKMRTPSIDSKQADGSMGLQIRDMSQKNKVWKHKSWNKTGYIGAFDRDRQGNIFVAPMPYVSLSKNPPKLQNQIYVIDSKTAEMTLFMQLPTDNPPNSKNPFGAMGLYYDCDTDSLYVSSLAGSEPMQEKGVIYQIDVKTKKIISTLKNTDAIGLGVFNTGKGKRLYFGSARSSGLYSVPLDTQGRFTPKKRYELALSQIKGGDTTIINKIKFIKNKNKLFMVLKEFEFGFRLVAENKPFKKKYNFAWDKKNSKWIFSGFSKE